MRWSLPISVFVHSALLLSAALALPDPEEFEVAEQEPVPVDVLSYEEFNQLRAQSNVVEEVTENPQPLEAEETPAQLAPTQPEPANDLEQVAALPEQVEPEPEPELAPEPIPEPELVEPEPEPEPTPEPEVVEPEPEPEAETETEVAYPLPTAKPPVPPRQQPEETENEFDPDQIAALLDKTLDEAAVPLTEPDEAGAPDRADQTNVEGSDSGLTADERALLIAQIEPCWHPPVGVSDAGTLRVKLRIFLNTDGSVDGTPEFLNTGTAAQFRAAAEAARRAVLRCQPYTMPVEKYGAWREVILNFDPRYMLGG
jgi:hypothetical protein